MTTTVGDRAPVAAAAATARDRAVRWAVVLGPALLALALGIQRSARLPLWRDEFATAMFAKLPIDDLLASLGHVDAVTGLYYLLAHATAPVLGYDTGLRMLSILAVAASTAVVALLALRWWCPLAASAAGVAFAVNESTLTSAALARQYALAVLFVALAVLAVEIAAATGRRWAWVGYAVAASAAVALHVLALVGIGLTALLLLGRARGAGRPWAWWCGATAIPAVVAVALLAPGLGQRGQLAWLSAPSLRTVIGDLADTAGVSADREVLFDGIALIVFAAMAAVALIAAVRPPATSWANMPAPESTPIARVRPVAFAVALTVAPWLVLAAASWLVTPILTARYISWSTLGAALVIAAAVHAVRTASRGLAIVAGTLAGVVLATSILVAIPRLWSLPPRETTSRPPSACSRARRRSATCSCCSSATTRAGSPSASRRQPTMQVRSTTCSAASPPVASRCSTCAASRARIRSAARPRAARWASARRSGWSACWSRRIRRS